MIDAVTKKLLKQKAINGQLAIKEAAPSCGTWMFRAIMPTTQMNLIQMYNVIFTFVAHFSCIVGKKWEPENLVPSRFSGQIRKVEARLGKLAKIRKVETN